MRHVFQRQEVAEPLEVRPSLHGRVLEQRFDFRTEDEASASVRIVERLDAEPIAGQQQPLLPDVPQRKGEHAPQLADAVVTGFFVEMNDHLRVTARRERMAATLQPCSELLEVIDLSVEHDDHAAVLVADRLPSSGEIDDAQAARPEPDVGIEIHALVVRPAVPDAPEHAVEHLRADRLANAVRVHAADSAHEKDPRVLVRSVSEK